MGLWPRPKLREAIRRARAKPPGEHPIIVGDSPYSERGTLVRKQRNDAAVSLLDEDTHGYVVVRLLQDDDGTGRIEVRGHVRGEHRPAFQRTLRRIAEHGLPPDG